MRVLYLAPHFSGYVRENVLREGLAAHGVKLIVVHHESPHFLKRYPKTIAKFCSREKVDAVILGDHNYVDFPLAWGLAKLLQIPLITDIYIGDYLFNLSVPSSVFATVRSWFRDKARISLADCFLTESKTMREYLYKTFRCPPERAHALYMGAEDWIFHPRPKEETEEMRVFLCAEAKPHQGMEVVLRAAKLLEGEPDITFHLVIKGPRANETIDLWRALNPKNLTLHSGWLQHAELADAVSRADVGLGGFGTNPQAALTLYSRPFYILASARTLVTADRPAPREFLSHGETALLTKPGDARALADALRLLRDDPGFRKRIAENGYRLYRERFCPKALGAEFKEILNEAIARR